ncbi:glycosyltransferase family 39 protein [Telluribacter humicola]|uniref:glycosyltransferase family 39 protein n=1 Tax=Telluribacter humicola TaxID=1720261 RepID=UPI001A97D265|nr:glycosyltransferase family 39 protein [Telluribacter humicola]
MHTPVRLPWLVWLLALISVALHLVFFNNLGYHRDELLYFSLGKHPAWGYASVPPLVGLLSWLIQSLLGDSLFAVKLVPALMSGVMVVLGAFLAQQLGGRKYAMKLAAVGMIVPPLMLRAYFLYQPVFLDIFFWTLCYYWFIRYLNTDAPRYLYFLSATAGLGFLNKYLILLLIFCLITSLLLSRRRIILQSKHFVGALLLGFVVVLPNLIWQFAHGLPVTQHMNALETTQLTHVDRVAFLVEQVLMPFAAMPLVITGVVYMLRMRRFKAVAMSALLVVAVLFSVQGKSYYTAGVFPLLISCGTIFWERVLKTPLTRIGLPVLMILVTLPLLPLGLPVFGTKGLVAYFNGLEENFGIDFGRRFEDGTVHPLPQDYADMIGWEELTTIVDKAYQQTQDKSQTLIYCENYGQAGAVTIIGSRYNLPEPMCFNESFLYWAPRLLDKDIQEFIYVNDELGEDIPALFADIKEVGRITNPYARERGTQVYLCRQPKVNISQFLRKRIAEETPF